MIHRQQEDIYIFETLKPTPVDRPPLTRPHFLILPKLFHSPVTKHSNLCTYGGPFSFIPPQSIMARLYVGRSLRPYCTSSQEAEGSKMLILRAFLVFTQSRTFACGKVLPTFRLALRSSLEPFWKLTHRHAQSFIFQVISNPLGWQSRLTSTYTMVLKWFFYPVDYFTRPQKLRDFC